MFPIVGLYVAEYTARGIADGVSRAIRDGTLPPGTKLPPIREVADQFQCSPTTVSAAWALLSRAGLIHSDRRRGTVVIEQARTRPGRYRQNLVPPTIMPIDLSTGMPDPDLLPDLAP